MYLGEHYAVDLLAGMAKCYAAAGLYMEATRVCRTAPMRTLIMDIPWLSVYPRASASPQTLLLP